MLRTCLVCSGFLPDSCTTCPHCSCAVGGVDLEGAAAKAPSKQPSKRARLLRRVMKGTLIAGSSMVLAACYGCPPDECGGDDLDGYGGAGATTGTGGNATGGSATGGNASGGNASGGSGVGGSDLGGGAGEGGLGGFAGEGGATP
jgi:hypothetical protein